MLADQPNLRIDADRLWSSLMELAQIGGTDKGGVRGIALSDLDRLGNVFARREGRDPGRPPIMTRSHLDTQPTGGKFDGAYGVMAGLEVMRVCLRWRLRTGLRANAIRLIAATTTTNNLSKNRPLPPAIDHDLPEPGRRDARSASSRRRPKDNL